MTENENNHSVVRCLNQETIQNFEYSQHLPYSLSDSDLERLLKQSLDFLDDNKVLKDIGLFPIPEEEEESLQHYVEAMAVPRRDMKVEKVTNIVGVIWNRVQKSA
ncbi:hypothetical protein GpartN1_g2249.t1 [Galdieria partita]|uniref:Uncharacterized protein n=1 Tax=Galdieria partita TaxID=83374 RepID=A0A9C7PTF0_9RHOD|nr:hypothetical protein GpartN1_g2249.t1 [Galdieria partita]